MYYNINDLSKIKKAIINNKRTIMFYYYHWNFYGTVRVLSILITELVKKYNVILVSGGGVGFSLPNSVYHIKIDTSDKNKIVDDLLAISLNLSVDLFIGQPNVLDYVVKSYKEFKKNNIKTIACNHENYFRPLEANYFYFLQTFRNKELNNANVVTWLTSYYNSVYSKFNSNGIVMPNPLVFDVHSSEHELNFKAIAVGNFKNNPIKRIDLIIEVFSKILKRKSEAELYIVGDYDQNELNCLLKKFDISSNNIHLTGCVDDVSKYYDDCSVLLMTSETEGFPMVLLEAGAFGLPAVILEIFGLDDIVTNGKNGFIIDRDNLDLMADKVVELFSNKELYYIMSRNSLEMSKRFSKDKIIARWNNLIEYVINIDNQDELDKILKKEFCTDNVDKDVLIKWLVTIYEKNFSNSVLYYENKISNLDNLLKNSEIQNLRNQNNTKDQAIKLLQNSWSYRIGRLITYPFSIPFDLYKFIRDYNLIKKSDLFDSEYYLANNEDVKNAKMDPIKHYLKFGWKEGRNPSPFFNTNDYLHKRQDVRVAGICPLVHYLKFGRNEI